MAVYIYFKRFSATYFIERKALLHKMLSYLNTYEVNVELNQKVGANVHLFIRPFRGYPEELKPFYRDDKSHSNILCAN